MSVQEPMVDPKDQNASAPGGLCGRLGFSLVEVVLAIAVVSFALLAIIALLPVGLNSMRSSREEAFAAQVLKSLANSVQGAFPVSGSSGRYSSLPPFDDAARGGRLEWQLGQVPQNGQTILIGKNGQPTTDTNSAKLVVFVRITPPRDLLSAGIASLTLAWPANAMTTPVTWQNGLPQYSNAQGSVETVTYFIPKPQ